MLSSVNLAADPAAPAQPSVPDAGVVAPIERLPIAVTAFVGRALKGPVDAATLVTDFAQFQQQFGGPWQPATLGYAVEQYFENGGRQALIVRVANGARAPTLRLPAGRGELLLQGCNPGTREYLRASVDYDGIGPDDIDQFNLVLQRVRAPDTELIEEQEILRRLSVRPEAERSVGLLLGRSRLARLAGEPPRERPDRTLSSAPGVAIGYVAAGADGSDGVELTDYDLIGDPARGSGLFALRSGPRFGLLCVPPLSRTRDVGMATLLVAARLCRERQGLLVVDPPASWDSVEAAIAGASQWEFQSENAVLYFPRLRAPDRLRGRLELFAPCGAAAGLIARGDELCPPWVAAAGEPPLLRAPFRLPFGFDEAQRALLAQRGVNCFDQLRPGVGAVRSARTFLPENAARGETRYLPARRLTLWLQACIVDGTRWMRLVSGGPDQWRRAQAQVEAFLEGLAANGAFPGRDAEERYFVICDARLNPPELVSEGRCGLLFGFSVWRPGEFQTCLVTHERGGSTVRAVTINRLATPGERVAEEIETAILRQLVLPVPR
jgi:uncharacterized protein